MNHEIIEVYVQLLDEGTPTIRPTKADRLSDGICKIHASPDYDPEDETWEFLPESIVNYAPAKTDEGENILLVISQAV